MTRDWSCALVEDRYLAVLPDTAAGLAKAIADSPSRLWMEDPAHWLPKVAAGVRAAEGDGR
ncbi:MAG: hypothetical protein JWO31_3872 [Phycisphaerales bacterium]|nr:hypothetical protein [Phycisphaerales bacterium]